MRTAVRYGALAANRTRAVSFPTDETGRVVGATVRDASGATLGTVTSLLVDPDALAARWLEVALADGGRAIVPVQAASTDASGRLLIPFSAADLRSAPRVDGTMVTADTATALLDHYGFPPEAR